MNTKPSQGDTQLERGMCLKTGRVIGEYRVILNFVQRAENPARVVLNIARNSSVERLGNLSVK
jgi:hypothetical protein